MDPIIRGKMMKFCLTFLLLSCCTMNPWENLQKEISKFELENTINKIKDNPFIFILQSSLQIISNYLFMCQECVEIRQTATTRDTATCNPKYCELLLAIIKIPAKRNTFPKFKKYPST